MGPTNDRLLQARLFAYLDTQKHRLGTNHELLLYNDPYRRPYHNHEYRDGAMRIMHINPEPNYQPNSISKRHPVFEANKNTIYQPYLVQGLVAKMKPNRPEDNFSQPGTLFRKVISEEMREHVIDNLAEDLREVKM